MAGYDLICNLSRHKIKDLTINIIKTSHDASESFGYIIESTNKSIVYITDTGYINNKYFELLSNKNVYILESNHDIEMLNNGPYPFKLRQRILGDKGHLSNEDGADCGHVPSPPHSSSHSNSSSSLPSPPVSSHVAQQSNVS